MKMPVLCMHCGDSVELNDTRQPAREHPDLLWCPECIEQLRQAQRRHEELVPARSGEWDDLSFEQKLEWL